MILEGPLGLSMAEIPPARDQVNTLRMTRLPTMSVRHKTFPLRPPAAPGSHCVAPAALLFKFWEAQMGEDSGGGMAKPGLYAVLDSNLERIEGYQGSSWMSTEDFLKE